MLVKNRILPCTALAVATIVGGIGYAFMVSPKSVDFYQYGTVTKVGQCDQYGECVINVDAPWGGMYNYSSGPVMVGQRVLRYCEAYTDGRADVCYKRWYPNNYLKYGSESEARKKNQGVPEMSELPTVILLFVIALAWMLFSHEWKKRRLLSEELLTLDEDQYHYVAQAIFFGASRKESIKYARLMSTDPKKARLMLPTIVRRGKQKKRDDMRYYTFMSIPKDRQLKVLILLMKRSTLRAAKERLE